MMTVNSLRTGPLKNLAQWIRTVPVLSDLYLYIRYPFSHYRGKYSTYEDAKRKIARQYESGYDISQVHPSSLLGCDGIRPYDFPLVNLLRDILQEGSRVIDLGGSVGTDYYRYRQAIDFPEDLHWLVCEVPAAVEMGQALALSQRCSNLSFSADFHKAEGADILLTNGALQYLEPSIGALLQLLTLTPQHVLINYVPCYDGEPFYTIQNLLETRCPYKIQNRKKLIQELEAQGYQLIKSWHSPRKCIIPFHPECNVKSYQGFYFQRPV